MRYLARASHLVLAVSLVSCDSATGPGDNDPFAAALGRLGVGAFASCGVRGGAAYCWGEGVSGQLGNGITETSLVPVAVSGGQSFSSVSGGMNHSCGLTSARQAFCWGSNESGQLGNGTTTNSSTPVAVAGGLSFSTISAGFAFTCALTVGGAAYCWGEAGLGNSTTTNSSVPVAVAGGHQFTSISAADGDEGYSACALAVGGSAYCWGDNWAGQLGDGGASGSGSLEPVAVTGGHTFQSIGVSDAHACGLTTAGEVYCWGWNHQYQLGDGTTTNRSTPVKVGGGLSFAALFVGEYTNCGVSEPGAAFCWGDNRSGQLGTGTAGGNNITPTAVAGGHSFATIGLGWNYTCGITMAGQALCWGRNDRGQLGNGTTTDSSVPIPVTGWN